MLRRFIERFPKSSRRREVEQRATDLAAVPPTTPAPRAPATGKSKCFSFDGR